MSEDFCTFSVPPDIEPEVKIFVEKVQEAAGEQNGFAQDDVALIKPDTRHFDGGDVVLATLSISGVAIGWVTKAWVDKYVVPVILERLKAPSEQFQKWLRKVLEVRDSGTQES